MSRNIDFLNALSFQAPVSGKRPNASCIGKIPWLTTHGDSISLLPLMPNNLENVA